MIILWCTTIRLIPYKIFKPGCLEVAHKVAPSSFQGLRIVVTSDAKSMKQKVHHVFNTY